MADMYNPGSGDFATWGVNAAQLARAGGKPDAGKLRPRGNSKGGSDSFLGTKANRRQEHGRMGASLHPVMKYVEPNSSEAGKECRNVHMMPSRSSWTDNWRGAARKLQAGVSY